MITFLHLGQHGRLGNQMFQYALLLGISEKNGYSFAIPKEHHSLKECFNIKCKAYSFNDADKIVKNLKFYRETYFHFNEIVFNLLDDMIYVGNFQTEKYFKHCESSVREQFSFKQDIYDASKQFIQSNRKQDKKLVSVHVRRGDYLTRPHEHPVQTLEWYKIAFDKFNKQETRFIVFSDDLKWCKENFSNLDLDIVYSNLSSNYEDLCAMTLCDSNIIANSSFSWWGAWLNNNPDKVVIAPKNWFGPAYNYHDTKDLYCNYWTILE